MQQRETRFDYEPEKNSLKDFHFIDINTINEKVGKWNNLLLIFLHGKLRKLPTHKLQR